MGRATNKALHPCRAQSPSLPRVCVSIPNAKGGPGWNQGQHYWAPRTRDPVEVPMGLEYSPPACEETWDLWSHKSDSSRGAGVLCLAPESYVLQPPMDRGEKKPSVFSQGQGKREVTAGNLPGPGSSELV